MSKNPKNNITGSVLLIVVVLAILFLPLIPFNGRFYSLSYLKKTCSGFIGQLASAFSPDYSTSCSFVEFSYYGLFVIGMLAILFILSRLLKKK